MRFRITLLAIALIVQPALASAGILARAISVSGDSISRGFDANTSSCNYGDNVSRNWATGDNHGSSYCSAGSGGTFSHAERLECNAGGDVTIFNDAESGATMRGDFAAQSASIRSNLISVTGPRYAVVLMGHNDACTNTLSKTGNSCSGDSDPNNYCRTTNAAFEREFREGLDQLIQIPGLRLGVLATVRVSELCNFRSKDGCGPTFGANCSTIWTGAGFLEDVFGAGGVCASLTSDCSDQRRIDMYNTLVGYNEVLERVSAEYEAIPAGGQSAGGATKAADVHVKYGDGSFYYKLASNDLSCCDCFHPSDLGQSKLADFVWNGMQCSATNPCCADTGNALNDARCDANDTASFYPGGFWPNDISCPNELVEPGEDCDDGNTADSDCCTAICTYAPPGAPCTPDTNVCTNDVCTATGTCTHPNNSASCNDGNACTQTDQCQSGTCVGSNTVVCTAQDQCHVAGTCSPATGACSNPAKPNGSACTDGSACTQTDQCQTGSCVGGNPVVCSALDQCHDAGTCSPATGVCSNPAKPNGSACTDGSACTQTDACQSGSCVGGSPVVCSALDQCHTAGTCAPATGVCSNPTKPNGSACTDGSACTQTDTCQSGSCVGGNPVVCSASDQCHAVGTCSLVTGACSDPSRPDGTTCNDGNACTVADQCTTGQCAGVSETCGDGVLQSACNEQCDHGAANGVDECCSEVCEPIDNDGDGTCDGEDACTGQVPIRRSKLMVGGLDTPAGDDTLLFKGEVALPFPFDPPLDPAANGVRVILSDANGVVLDTELAGGAAWSGDASAGRWKYGDKSGSPPGGITRASIRGSSRAPGALKVSLKGREADYPAAADALPLSLVMVFDPPAATTGQCGLAEFVSTPPAPSCTANGSGSRITCR